jgi:hypothetical protein
VGHCGASPGLGADVESAEALCEACGGERPARLHSGEEPAAGGRCADAEVAATLTGESAQQPGERFGDIDICIAEADPDVIVAADHLVGGHRDYARQWLAVEQQQRTGDPVDEFELIVVQQPVGFRYSADDVLGSGGSPVFVYEAAEDWSPDDACGSVVTGVLGSRWVQLLAAVGTLGVVVADVFAEEQSKMSLAEDQYPVGEFGSDGSYESFSEAVRLWTLGWDLHDADTGVGEDGVEGRRELAGSIPYE